MRKYFQRFAILILTFLIGVGITSYFYSTLYEALPDSNEPALQLQGEEKHKVQKLTFQSGPIIDPAYPVQWWPTDFIASDGEGISCRSRNVKSEKSALTIFEREIKNTGKVLEIFPYLDYWNKKVGEKAFVESGGKVYIIEYYEIWWETEESYDLEVIETPSLRHALAFEDWKESSERGLVTRQLKP